MQREYALLEHAYRTLSQRQQPLSVHRFMLPLIAEKIFDMPEVKKKLSQSDKEYLCSKRHVVMPKEEQIENQFQIGEKQDSTQNNVLDMKKIVHNVGSIFNGLIGLKK